MEEVEWEKIPPDTDFTFCLPAVTSCTDLSPHSHTPALILGSVCNYSAYRGPISTAFHSLYTHSFEELVALGLTFA